MHQAVIALAGLVYGLATPAPATPSHFINAKLVAESVTPRAGRSVLVALRMSPRRGWHGYWSNPGESGLATAVTWNAPAGVHFGPLQHPAPTLLQVQGLTSYVHAGPHVLISRMNIDRSLPVGTVLPISADVSWAACSDKLCVPEKARLSIRMVVGNGEPTGDASDVHRAAAAEPRQIADGIYQVSGGKLLLQLPRNTSLDDSRVQFFPDDNGYFDPSRSRVLAGSPLRVAMVHSGTVPRLITGVISDGATAYRVAFRAGRTAETPAKASQTRSTMAVPRSETAPPAGLDRPAAPESARQATSNPLFTWALFVLGLMAASAAVMALRRRSARTRI